MSSTKILLPDQQRSVVVNEGDVDELTQRNTQRSLSPDVNRSEWNVPKRKLLKCTINVNVGGAADRSFHQANALHITRTNSTPGGYCDQRR